MKPFKKLNAKIYYLPAALIALFIISAIASPVLIRNRKADWENILKQKVQSSEKIIRNIVKDKITSLILYKSILKTEIKKNISNDDLRNTNNILLKNGNDEFTVQIFNENNDLIYWAGDELNVKPDSMQIRDYLGQAVFCTNKLIKYISVIDTLITGNQKLFLLVGLPLEFQFSPADAGELPQNITSILSKLLNTSVKIYFDPAAQITIDGRNHSFALLNNFNNEIGVVDFEKPALDNDIYQLGNTLNAVQSSIVIFLLLSIGWIIYTKIKHGKKIVRFVFYLIFISLFRLLLFYTGVPSIFFTNELTDATNFSSTFAFGIVRSPLEFAITAVLGFSVILTGFRFFLEYYDSEIKKNISWFRFIIVLLAGFFLVLLILRGLGASLRSVVFDSSIRYFKEFNIIPNASTFLMDFNILLVGLSVFLLCLIILMYTHLLIPYKSSIKKNILYAGLFVFLQLCGILFDLLQKQPQGTPLIRFLFITVLFVLGYLLIFRNYRSVVKYLLIAFGASIATVSLLTYYNSEIERESLKTTAQDLTRSNENIYQFMVFQTLSSAQNDNEIKNDFLRNKEMSPEAFVQWSKSLFYHETLPAQISFYDNRLNLTGKFSNSKFDNSVSSVPFLKNDLTNPRIEITPVIFGGKVNIHGSAAIMNGATVLGYVSVSVIYDESYFNFVNLPDFLTSEKSGISSALNLERLKIFFIHNGDIEKSYGAVQLSERDVKKISGYKFSKHNEGWLKLKIAGENYLFYLLNIEGKESRILAVAKEEKNFTWSLSDFFKVFFVHTVIILAVFFFLAILNYKKLLVFTNSYKTKLAAAFVIVSVVPLILIAIYFKNITEGKNTELIFNRLGDTAGQIENYLKNYLDRTSVQPELLFEKTAGDLNVNFSVYNNKKIFYSSNIDYYKSGLISELLPMKVWNDIQFTGLDKSFYKTSDSYYSVYLKPDLPENDFILEVNSRFNNTSLPLSDIDVNIFMFGIFSLAIIMLIIFSTVLAEQISAPIRKLTSATRSLGGGDLNVEVSGNYKGEIAELTNGFNMMVTRLRKSQFEMAQLERETAWKEMAKQVAHEIKNPLTPMKLSVQQLIAAYNDKSPKFDSIFQKVTTTVIAQIETLKNIASEFSNFARMPKLNIEKINLIDSIKETINLFMNENLHIKYSCGENEIYVNADHDQLNRTLVNLIRNSMQATAKNIFIYISVENNFSLIRLIDDGTGIEIENIEKVFEDKFTTKSGGMGLGLSMARKFLESISGKIIIEKSSAEGTSFLITIPLAE